MLLHILFCGVSVAASTVLFNTVPTLSLWWLPLILVGGYAAAALLLILAVVLFSCFMRGAKPSGARRAFYRLIARLMQWACLLCRIDVQATGAEDLPKQPFLLVGNHLSNLDPLIALAALKGREAAFVSKPENFKIPVVGFVMHNAAFLPIDRENPRNAVTTIKTAAQHITERGLCVGIYPEGTRNKTGARLLPFHNGSFKIATAAKCPVAVMTVRYEEGLFPYERRAIVRFVEVLDAEYIAANRTDAISERVKEIIEKDLKKQT